MSGAPQSELLVRIAEETWTVGQTLEGDPFAVDHEHLPGIAWPLRARGGSLRAQLANQFRDRHGKPPGSGALADAMAVLEGQALAAPRSEVSLRVARPSTDCIAVDLARPGSSACVVISPGRWEVTDQPPDGVLFHRTRLTGALPIPTAPDKGDLGALHSLINISTDDQALVDAFLAATLIADIPHPILALQSRHGAAKTTTARMLVQTVDPSPAPLRASPSDLDQWVTAAAGSWVVALDNVSGFAFWMQDALCRASTGEALVRRALYTDADLSLVTFRRVVIITGIDFGGLRGDLADRAILLQPEAITPDRRRAEADLNAAYDAALPSITAGLYSLTADVLDVLDTVHLADPPRMADFARIVAAVDELTDRAGLARYAQLGSTLAADVVEADEVGRAVLRLMDTRNTWEGTASDLLAKVTPDHPTKSWPADATRFGGRLSRATPALEDAGLTIERGRSAKGVTYSIKRTDSAADVAETPFLFSSDEGGEGETEGDRATPAAQQHDDEVPSHVLDQWAERDLGQDDHAA